MKLTKKIILSAGTLLLLLVLGMKFILPLTLEALINHSGSDEAGYNFRIKDLGLKPFQGEVVVRSIDIFNRKNSHVYLKARGVILDFNLFSILTKHKILSFQADLMSATISKDFFDEVKRVKNEAKKKASYEIYFKKISTDVKKLNIRILQDGKSRSIMTLNGLHATIKDLGLGKPEKETSMNLSSAIEGGGEMELSGKTKLEKDRSPWIFSGELKKITPQIIEKLAGQDFPFDVEASNFDAKIHAHSTGKEIIGEISPHLKELKVNADQEKGFLKRNIAKAANFVAEKLKDDTGEFTITLPFILNENFKLDLKDSWKRFQKK